MQISSPLNFIENADLSRNVQLVINNFRPIFLDKSNRPEFMGKFIFFDMTATKGIVTFPYPEKLMHIMSLEPKNHHTIFPCNNDESLIHCQNKCDSSCADEHFQLLKRNECYYRMARIHWIPEIINLANASNPSTQVWIESKSPNGKRFEKTFIRFQEGLVDYIIILRHVIRSGTFTHYALESAFPVFLKRNKIQFTKDFEAYTKNTTGTQNTAV